MAKTVLRQGKVVIVLRGRYAGKKAVVLQSVEENQKDRKYSHALVAGIERCPLKVQKRMDRRTIMIRSRVKPFVKTINLNHIMPTRYTFETEGIEKTCMKVAQDVGTKMGRKLKLKLKRMMEQRYRSGKNRWFFTKLRF